MFDHRHAGVTLLTDPVETVFDPNEVFDWYRLTMEEVSRADREQACPDRAAEDNALGALSIWSRMVARHQAALYESIMGVVAAYDRLDLACGVDDVFEMASAELRAALHLTRNAADRELELASDLVDRLPLVLQALKDGRIDLRRARVICMETAHLELPEARMVCERVIGPAETLTTAQLAAHIRRLCLELDPSLARERQRRAVEDRGVWAELRETSTAEITAWGLSPVRVARAMNRIHQIARRLASPSESRSLDQIEADVFLDLLEGTHPETYRRGVTDIRVELTTLLGLDEKAVEMAGFGPVIQDVLDQIDIRSEWRVTVTEGGLPVETVSTRRRPTTMTRRTVEARDQTCVFPGCRRPATECDLDHRILYSEGGLTNPDQLAPLCRHDHVIRHKAGWTHRRNSDGSHTWRSPLGATYQRPPPI